MKHSGGCLCGEVRFEVEGKPSFVGVCHCKDCQLRTGSLFGVGVFFAEEKMGFYPETSKTIPMKRRVEIPSGLRDVQTAEHQSFGKVLRFLALQELLEVHMIPPHSGMT